ncbi:MAG: hypothetical protein ABH826_00615 [Patescibacteria group bacterium]|nr:hypothetical protein [Patescibacteria group bacterium]
MGLTQTEIKILNAVVDATQRVKASAEFDAEFYLPSGNDSPEARVKALTEVAEYQRIAEATKLIRKASAEGLLNRLRGSERGG